jgi:outer membrane receptor protein involved in Fe transport
MLKRTPLSVCLGAALGGLLSVNPAFAQEPQKLERIEVTGSNIKRVDAEGLAPVVTIKRSDIERSGKTTVADLLANLPAISGGSFSEASLAGNSFAPGTASVSLRGLGVNTTLTLLNGRRIANYGFAQNINEGFVDLNSIPVAAIERIEILKDGASAVYGSDAIAGVINVILRKDYRGLEGFVSYGDTQQGGAAESRASITGGIGEPNRWNITGTLDYYHREKLNALQREFSATADNRGQGPGGRDIRSPTGNPGYFFGGTGNVNTPLASCPASSVVPASTLGVGGGGNVCAFDFVYANNLMPETERVGGLFTASVTLSDSAELFAELMVNRNTTERSAAPTPAAFSLGATHPDRPAGSTFTSVAHRFVEAGNRENTTTTDTTRAVLGVRGTMAGFDYEAGLLKGESDTLDASRNYIIQERANEAFSGTLAGYTGQFYRFGNIAAMPAGMLDAIKIDPKRRGLSKVESIDFKISRELFDMAGGPAAFAAGLEMRDESVSDTPDFRVALTNPNRVTVAGSGGTAVAGERDMKSGYVEVSLPFAKGWETQLAVRSDRYSDFGDATTPKVGISYRPNKQFLARAGYAEGFRAPSLAEIYLGESTSFPVVQDAPRCAEYRTGLGANDPRTLAVCGGATGNGASAQVRSVFLGNRNLQPEKSKSYSLGFVFEPVRNLVVAVDGYLIEHTNRILSPTAAFILANEALFPGAVTRNARTADDIAAGARGSLRGVSGDLVPGITRTFFNASAQRTHGVDLELRYGFSMGDLGRITASTAFSYIGALKRQLNPGQAMTEIAGTYQFPRLRNTTSATWVMGDWTMTGSLNTIGSYKDAFTVNGQFPKVEQYMTMDAQVAYSGFKRLTLTVGGRNITDKDAPFSNSDWYGYDASTHDPRSAYWYVKAGFKF